MFDSHSAAVTDLLGHQLQLSLPECKWDSGAFMQAVPEQATGLACGSAEFAFQLFCVHPDGRDPCSQSRGPLL